jgi:hypothetical protein
MAKSKKKNDAPVKDGAESLAETQADSSAIADKEIDLTAINIDGGRVIVHPDSLEASISYGSLLRELHHSYSCMVAYYRSREGGAHTPDEARALAYHAPENSKEAAELFSRLMSYSIDMVDFHDLHELWGADPKAAVFIWESMKAHGRDEFESGHLASKALMPVHYMRTAWNAASYLGMRESLIIDWQPSGAMELTLIDMLAQAFMQYQYWLKESVIRTQTVPRTEEPEYTQWKQYKTAAAKANGWSHGWWDIPYVKEQASIEHAAQMADRWNRIYMRTLRNLRDLRRYSVPVTINNPQQVNIAADGGQQVNVSAQE